MVADVLLLDDMRLKLVSQTVENFDAETKNLIDSMFLTMDTSKGLGLAAIQIGIDKRVIVLNVKDGHGNLHRMPMINPEITERSSETVATEEGCLSIPGVRLTLERPASVKVRYREPTGLIKEVEADGMFATCVQHELDHLDGVLIIDRVSRLKRDRAKAQYEKAKRGS